jgi:thiamine biosynthesis lipoprotein
VNGVGEVGERFDCFGSSCAALVTGAGREGSARDAVELVRRQLESWHASFSRFAPASELTRLNDDPRRSVAVSPLMARLAQSVRLAAAQTDGLVDATLVDPIERAGYSTDLGEPVPLALALELAPPRKRASGHPSRAWRSIESDLARGLVSRPPGVELDSGGLAKGLFADLLAERLAGHASFAIDCAGDLSIGGSAAAPRAIDVESPFDGRTLHTFHLRRTGVATSGIGRRSWLDAEGRPAHHLLDPSTGTPAFTGIVQVTALAPSALTAEIRAKAALLSGPTRARGWLPGGGVIVFDDGSHEAIEPPDEVLLSELSRYAHGARTHVLQDR